ncbi:MAG: fibronectin type III domain-containing protein [bacterium]|nr:fibronectin type III domain-containing protein [bacterium]
MTHCHKTQVRHLGLISILSVLCLLTVLVVHAAPLNDEAQRTISTNSTDAQGGPDGFGYRWMDSNEPGGPSYQNWNWYMGPTTTVTGLTDDNVVGPYNLTGGYTLYGVTYTQIYIGGNGTIYFGNAPSGSNRGSWPPSFWAPAVYIWNEDMYVRPNTTIVVQNPTNYGNTTRILFDQLGYYADPNASTSFWVDLSGGDISIYYGSQTGTQRFPGYAGIWGGISQYMLSWTATTPAPGTAVRFRLPPPATPVLQGDFPTTTTLTPTWIDYSTNEEYYWVYCLGITTSYSNNLNIPANSTSYTFTGLLPGNQYRVMVLAHNAGGNSTWIDYNTWTRPAVPAAPTLVSNGGGEAWFQIQNNTTTPNGTPTLYALVETLSGLYVGANGYLSTTPFLDTMKTRYMRTVRSSTYSVAVRAISPGFMIPTDWSEASPTINFSTRPSRPAIPTVATFTPTQVAIRIENNTTDPNGGDARYCLFEQIRGLYVANDGSLSSTPYWSTEMIRPLQFSMYTSYQIVSRAMSTAYPNAVDWSPSSPVLNFQTTPTYPTSPTGSGSFTGRSSTFATIWWTPTNQANMYTKIYRYRDGSSTLDTMITINNSTTFNYAFSGLRAGTHYLFNIYSYDPYWNANSQYCVSLYVDTDPYNPDAPVIGNRSANSIQVTIRNSSVLPNGPLTRYSIGFNTPGTTQNRYVDLSGQIVVGYAPLLPCSTFVVTGLLPGVTYNVQTWATTQNGTSVSYYSPVVTATTTSATVSGTNPAPIPGTPWTPTFPNDPATANQPPLNLNFGSSGTNPSRVDVVYSAIPPTLPIQPGANTIRRYFSINSTGGSGWSATLDLLFTDNDLPAGITDPRIAVPAMRTVSYNQSTMQWTTYTPIITLAQAGTPNVWRARMTNVTHFSDWVITQDQVLPVEGFVMSCSAGDRQVTLNWHVETEIGNAYFCIERRNVNGSWNEVARVNSLAPGGNSQVRTAYRYLDHSVLNDITYEYRMSDVGLDGHRTMHPAIVQATPGTTVSTLPTEFLLEQNTPNPFNPVTSISFDLPVGTKVRLSVFDITGHQVDLLANNDFVAGHHTVQFNGNRLPSGMYYYWLQAGKYSETKKMTLIK